MGIRDIFSKVSAETGIKAKFDRNHKFRLSRRKTPEGFEIYILENNASNERLYIDRFMFDRFRSVLRNFVEDRNNEETFHDEVKLNFKSSEKLIIKWVDDEKQDVGIIEPTPHRPPYGKMKLSVACIPTLMELLYDPRLDHPNDALDLIVAYHKLFQFTFAEGSASITSDLALRKDVLCIVDRYQPSLAKKTVDLNVDAEAAKDDGTEAKKVTKPTAGDSGERKKGLFRSRLGERSGTPAYKVDYEQLFAGRARDTQSPADDSSTNRKQKAAKADSCFPLPMIASDVKNFSQIPFRCEFTNDDIKEFRGQFLGNRDNEYFLGFEIMDAIYKKDGKFMTFNFPLYYIRVQVKESNRFVFLEPLDDGRVYLNHLALANLVETFGKPRAGHDPVDHFLKTLLAQNIEYKGGISRIHLSRMMPFDDEIFERTREVLLGGPTEGGKGGILSDLKVIGIEADLESVLLYKAAKSSGVLTSALEADLENIKRIAHEKPKRFYQSLLGQFLSPDVQVKQRKEEPFCKRPWIPGSLPKSTRRLLDRLTDNDLVLLEGPPGTGKTFTIFNLFLHCICSGKRMLIVSDQEAAIHALLEKFEDYLFGRDRESPAAKNLELLWKSAIKVIDQTPPAEGSLAQWCKILKKSLMLEQNRELDWPETDQDIEKKLASVDKKIANDTKKIQAIMQNRLGEDESSNGDIAPKRQQDTTSLEIQSLTTYSRLLKDEAKSAGNGAISQFFASRRVLGRPPLHQLYEYFDFPDSFDETYTRKRQLQLQLVATLLRKKPRSMEAFSAAATGQIDGTIKEWLRKQYLGAFPPQANGFMKFMRVFFSLFSYPLSGKLKSLAQVLSADVGVAGLGLDHDPHLSLQFRKLHRSLSPASEHPSLPLALEITQRYVNIDSGAPAGDTTDKNQEVLRLLLRIEKYYKERDELVRRCVLDRLSELAKRAFDTDETLGTNALTSLTATLDNLQTYTSVEAAGQVHQDLQEQLLRFFPIWVCRKQAVSFLFACKERHFDLVIVDEATQCRVDDALPLLFRGQKLLVVGDEKQTVLQKNSVIDDYLFNEFALDEHLRSTQARGMKGGGSHIFGLVKSIKQAVVMLDEHYRCPPEIIEFSNRYVYGGELKTMQWLRKGNPPSVIVDWSERKKKAATRAERGQFKGIETDMVDRFLDYVVGEVKRIEAETKQKINMETDVALCYFLLKNEPYVKRVKSDFLRKINRGHDVLDGAGAALQGKERDYIFYLWDISRANMLAFRQGDEPDKRKGELNVLMSRPKKRAYHFLHGSFDKLDHSKATIADYLWRKLNEGGEGYEEEREYQERTSSPGTDFVIWRRGSGQLMESLLEEPMQLKSAKSNLDTQHSVTVGNPHHCVDLMLLPPVEVDQPCIGIVDLAGFELNDKTAAEIVDYYFQLKRATPKIRPIFAFVHELVNERSTAFRLITGTAKPKKKAS